jgi:low affinity Fe/Cu permease
VRQSDGVTAALSLTRVRRVRDEPRGERDRRGLFDRLAQRASYFSSSPVFFLICVGMVLAWLGGYAFGAGSSYEQAVGTALTATTLLPVALLESAELRAEAAVQSKLDASATGMLEAIHNEGHKADPMLERAIGLDEQLRSTPSARWARRRRAMRA